MGTRVPETAAGGAHTSDGGEGGQDAGQELSEMVTRPARDAAEGDAGADAAAAATDEGAAADSDDDDDDDDDGDTVPAAEPATAPAAAPAAAAAPPAVPAAPPAPPTQESKDASLRAAAADGDIEAIAAHIAAGADVGCTLRADGRTPVHLALRGNHVRAASALLAAAQAAGKADKVAGVRQVDSCTGRTPLHSAAEGGAVEALQLLRGTSAVEDAAAYTWRGGMQPHHFAARAGSIAALRLLTTPIAAGGFGCDLRGTSKGGSTVLHFAAYNHHRELCEWLLTDAPEGAGASDLLVVENSYGDTAAVRCRLAVQRPAANAPEAEAARAAETASVADWLEACTRRAKGEPEPAPEPEPEAATAAAAPAAPATEGEGEAATTTAGAQASAGAPAAAAAAAAAAGTGPDAGAGPVGSGGAAVATAAAAAASARGGTAGSSARPPPCIPDPRPPSPDSEEAVEMAALFGKPLASVNAQLIAERIAWEAKDDAARASGAPWLGTEGEDASAGDGLVGRDGSGDAASTAVPMWHTPASDV